MALREKLDLIWLAFLLHFFSNRIKVTSQDPAVLLFPSHIFFSLLQVEKLKQCTAFLCAVGIVGAQALQPRVCWTWTKSLCVYFVSVVNQFRYTGTQFEDSKEEAELVIQLCLVCLNQWGCHAYLNPHRYACACHFTLANRRIWPESRACYCASLLF